MKYLAVYLQKIELVKFLSIEELYNLSFWNTYCHMEKNFFPLMINVAPCIMRAWMLWAWSTDLKRFLWFNIVYDLVLLHLFMCLVDELFFFLLIN